MSTEFSAIMAFVRQVYFSEGPISASDVQFRQIADDLRLFSLSAQVYQYLKRSGRLEEIPADLRGQLRREFEAALLKNLRLKHETEHILKHFEQHGIGAIPFNGTPFAEHYYGHYGGRSVLGIDILIHSSEFGEAAHALCSAGYGELTNIWTEDRALFGKESVSGNEWPVVELHTGLAGRPPQGNHENAYWRDAVPVGWSSYVKSLSPLHQLYMISMYGMNRRMSSLSYAIDIAAVLVQEGSRIEFAHLFKHAEREGTLRKVRTALAIVYGLFPELQEIKPYSKMPAKTVWSLSEIRKMAAGRSSPGLWLRKLRFDLFVSDGWKVPFHSLFGKGREEGWREARQH